MSFGYTIDKKVTDVLQASAFTISAEIVPPRNGEDQIATFKKLQRVIDSGVHFLSVTKGAGGSLRGGTLPMAQAIKDQFSRPCIAHFTCRDLLPEEIENSLIDHHYFGIRNILALRGDPPRGQEQWVARDGGYSYAYELIEQVTRLNRGQYLERKGFGKVDQKPTDFCIGCAVYPEHPEVSERVEFVAKKMDAGAEYGITQMLFDDRKMESFMNALAQRGLKLPLLPGLRILKSQQQADVMERQFGCAVPEWYRKALPVVSSPTDSKDLILQPFYKLVERLRQLQLPGVHVFVLSDTQLATMAIEHLLSHHL